MELVSYKEAIQQGLPKYFTGKPCKHGHISERRVSGRCCTICSSNIAIAWSKANPESSKKIRSNWDNANRTKTAERVRKYRIANPEKANKAIQNWRKKNIDFYMSYMALQAAKRNAAKLQRTPKWLNDGHLFEIESVYNYCSALRRIGLNYHVDHIVPLQGKNISGLHLPWNLQVLPAKINWVKGNKLWL